MRCETLAVAVLPMVLLALGACGDGDDAPDPAASCIDGSDGTATLVAEDVAWDADCIEAVADEPLVIAVDNRDDGVNHNLHLPDAPGEPSTELEAGPVTQRLEVDLPAGRYEFVCDIHPNMVGTLVLARATSPDP